MQSFRQFNEAAGIDITELEEALARVLDRMGTKMETLEQAIEAVQDDFGGKTFGAQLLTYAQGKAAYARIDGLTEEVLYHTSDVDFPDHKPTFDAYFGTADFLKSFPNEFGSRTYAIELPASVNILDLNVGTNTSVRFITAVYRSQWPTEPYDRQPGQSYTDFTNDFYDVWTDKKVIMKILRTPDFGTFQGVTYREEYILSQALIQRLKGWVVATPT